MNGALSDITAVPVAGSVEGGNTEPGEAYFVGDGATLVFEIDEDEDIKIQSVYVGGQRWVKDVGFSINNSLKQITFIAPYIPDVDQQIHVTYFKGLSVESGGIDITNLTPEQLQALAEDLAPYLI